MTGGAQGRAPRLGSALLLAVATVAGAGTMTVELSAVRMLAPWFGSSLAVWTNVIGVILLGLTLGYLVGARLSRGPRPLARLGACLLVSGLVTVWLPALAAPVCALFMPGDVALHDAAGLIGWGSLAASCALFLPSALLLGAVGPLAVEALQLATGSHAGTAGGRVLAASTLGSIAGTFATTHVLLPRAGIDATFLGAGVTLAAAGALGLWLQRGASRAALVTCALALVGLAAGVLRSQIALPDPRAGTREIARAQSAYQWIRVLASTGEDERRWLTVNEGLDSFQSVWSPRLGLLGEGHYYDDFALPAWWARAEGTWRVLVLGMGAGTTWRVLEGALPEDVRLEMVGVELDPEVVAAGRAHLGLPREHERLVVHAGIDARVALERTQGAFDQIVLDVYANQFEIPPHLSTVELFRAARERLVRGGWLVTNVGGWGFDDPVVRALAATIAAAFETQVLALRVPSARNYVLFARRDARPPVPGTDAWGAAGPVPDALLPKREIDGAWCLFEHGGDGVVLTDDTNPIEPLQMRSIEEGRARLRGTP